MKRFLPLLTIGLVFLGACGLEKPPYKIEENAKESAKKAEPAKAAAPTDPKLAAGKTVYEGGCGGCHDAGVMGAPKIGDMAAWKDRLPQGVEAMAKKSVQGFQGKAGMMPAKGGNASLTDEQIANAVAFMVDKVKPAGTAAPAPAAAPAAAAAGDPKLAAGKTVYEGGCGGCHDAGVMGAPKIGDKAAWKDRLPQGVAAMAKKSVQGFQGKVGMMPAKGGNASLTDEQIANAVAFMVEKSR